MFMVVTKNKLIARPSYFNFILPFINKPVIKILTGIRRCGKSTILQLIIQELKERGVSEKNIIHINFESLRFSDIKSATTLYDHIKSLISGTEVNYLFFDEIQEVTNWEKAINSFLVDFHVDIYLSGSNSNLLSSELATYLAGRYIEISVYTLSFKEFLEFEKGKGIEITNIYSSFRKYLELGGFPGTHIVAYKKEDLYKVVYDIYSSVILRDTIQRHNIRDLPLLEKILKYVIDNIGNTFSGKKVADYFKSQQRRVDINTVYNYLYALESAFIIHKTLRYDLQGKEILKTQEKYYLSDISIMHAVIGFQDRKIPSILENIVYLELRRRGYEVFIGKTGHEEIDFVALKSGEKLYVQVAYRLDLESTIDREFSNLLKIADQFPKYVVSMDETWKSTYEGINHYHIADFLLLDQWV